MVKVTDEKGLKQFLQNISKDYNIAVPVRKEKGKKEVVEYDIVEDFDNIDLDSQADTSPKEFFLPQDEKIEKIQENEKKTIIFGVRSCDIEAIKVLDSVFLDDDYVDVHYKNKRENTIVFALSCEDRFKSCFCDVLGIDPVENNSEPFTVYKFDNEIWINVNDSNYADLVSDLEDGKQEELENKIQSRKDSFTDTNFDLDLSFPISDKEVFTAPIWEEIAEKCLGCGVCTFYCPTCFCFGFFWEDEKYRSWDSCMFSMFTEHASGHNPRETQNQRWRQRLMHKFSYHPQNFDGQLACVGCGRCVNRCPVNLDIRKALKTVERYLDEKGGGE